MPVFALPAIAKGVAVAYGTYFAVKTAYGLFVDAETGHHPLLERVGLVVSGVVRKSNPAVLTFTIVEQGVFTVLELLKDAPAGETIGATTPPMWQRDP